IKNSNPQKEVVVINTHFHWDHIWGNCSFAKSDIIAHELSRCKMDEVWESQIQRNEKYVMGEIVKQLPNITFSEKLSFLQEGIELFHSPGHTKDCISVFDHQEGILYVGDNLEKPLIYVEDPDVTTYIATLKNYLAYKPKKIIASHTLEITEADLINTIAYLEGLLMGKEMQFASEYEKQIHEQNLKVVGVPPCQL
ncbi:MAG: MBL fold metallo-hydrolase, partial [Vallitaleaceae bacterium]|nr:MBL fold metallo-hydrolase [Vallitaleaceae bacterium]